MTFPTKTTTWLLLCLFGTCLYGLQTTQSVFAQSVKEAVKECSKCKGKVCMCNAEKQEAAKWTPMMDGKTFAGWKINEENSKSWSIEDGAFKADGDRSHVFYVGDGKPFKNFELELNVMTTPGSNGGVYFCTKYQAKGWPIEGFEAQVNATHKDPKKTGSLYAVKNIMKAPHADNKWFLYNIKVVGKKITIRVDGKVTVEYTEPENVKPGKTYPRVLQSGTFAFQAHDPKSVVYFKDAKVRRLP